VLAIFAVIASALSAAGLYGLTAFGVAQRTSEIGLRTALGARRLQIAWIFLRSTLIYAAVGLAFGLVGVVAAGQMIAAVLVETSGVDIVVLASLVAALAAIIASACFFPARRAMRLDPIAALRHD
jgi:ABC-type antimicrobial peptide transport system permease subunit